MLTVEEVKALPKGEWFWLVVDGKPIGYREVLNNEYDYIQTYDHGLDIRKGYGTDWAAYRTKFDSLK